jgi:hypothetical protein
LGRFFRRLRRTLGGEAFPYLWTPEWHPGGHGLHAHFAVGRYVARGAIERAWPHGFVHIKLLGDLPYNSSALEQPRLAARYLSKYVSKAIDEDRPGLHRYDVAQRFAPRPETYRGRSSEEVMAWAAERMGRWPDYSTSSGDWDRYVGPPAVFVSWN